MKPILVVLVVLLFLSACNVPETLTDTVTFPLKEFVMEGDRAFSYEGVETVDGETWTEYRIKRRIGSFPHFITTGNVTESGPLQLRIMLERA